MEIRILTEEESGTFKDLPRDPSDFLVIGAIDNGQIVGRLLCANIPHIECAWIDEAHRNGIVLARMEQFMATRLRRLGARKAFAFAVNGTMRDYLKRLGYSDTNWSVWEKEI